MAPISFGLTRADRPAAEGHTPFKEDNKRTRAKQWLRRHRLIRGERVKTKRGCTELHTSTRASYPHPSELHPSPLRHFHLQQTSPMSFHSCYSYEREGYNWWWYHTLQEVLRNYLWNGASKMSSMIRMGSTSRLSVASHHGTMSHMSQFTPSMRHSPSMRGYFSDSEGDRFQLPDQLPDRPPSPSETPFWEQGFEYLKAPAPKCLKALPRTFPYACLGEDGVVMYTPPINLMSGICWSTEDESRLDFISLRPSTPTTPAQQRQELFRLAESMRGHWITDMARSSSIDQHFKYLGLAYVKRSILCRIAIPISMFLEGQEEDGTFSNLHTWIHTPIGLRHTNWSTCGELSVDNDPDCGEWEGFVRAVNIYLPSVSRPVRALQRIMQRPGRPECGISVETRCVLPDAQQGRVLLFQLDAFPSAFRADYMTDCSHTTRVLSFEHPVDNVLELSSKTALTESGSLNGCTRISETVGPRGEGPGE